MNYVHHALIGVGTAGLGVAALEAVFHSQLPFATLGIGTLIVAVGSIATDLDHPKSFISNSIPSDVIRITLVILVIPLLAALAALLTTSNLSGTFAQVSGLVLGISILRWAVAGLGIALGLMLLSWLLYRSLHHRGPLHSLLFTAAITGAACFAFWWFYYPWTWGLLFGWGWLWHILGDGLTKEGVPFFWPFDDARLHTLPEWVRGIARTTLSLLALGGIVLPVVLQVSGYLTSLPNP